VDEESLFEITRGHLAEVERLSGDRKLVRGALGELVAALGGLGEDGGGARLAGALVDAHVALEATKNDENLVTALEGSL